jgi:8-oxo-dGTP diphosphatase
MRTGKGRSRQSLIGALYRQFGRLPESWRHFIVGHSSPAHRVGTAAVVRDGGRVLLARHSYRKGWALPGGMMGWSEHPADTIVREVAEEVGLATVVAEEPYVYWLRRPRRVEFLYELSLAPGASAGDVAARSPEIEEVRWFAEDDLPDLSPKTTEMLAWIDEVRESRCRQAANLAMSRSAGAQGT